MNLVMRRNPTTFDLRHGTSRDVLLTIDDHETFRVLYAPGNSSCICLKECK